VRYRSQCRTLNIRCGIESCTSHVVLNYFFQSDRSKTVLGRSDVFRASPWLDHRRRSVGRRSIHTTVTTSTRPERPVVRSSSIQLVRAMRRPSVCTGQTHRTTVPSMPRYGPMYNSRRRWAKCNVKSPTSTVSSGWDVDGCVPLRHADIVFAHAAPIGHRLGHIRGATTVTRQTRQETTTPLSDEWLVPAWPRGWLHQVDTAPYRTLLCFRRVTLSQHAVEMVSWTTDKPSRHSCAVSQLGPECTLSVCSASVGCCWNIRVGHGKYSLMV